MPVLVYAESSEGKFKKVALEATSYGKKVAQQLKDSLVVLTINCDNPSELNTYGADKIVTVSSNKNNSDAKFVANSIQQTAQKENASVIIIDSSANGLSIAPIVAIKLNAGYASNVVALPNSTSPLIVKRKSFSNKAFNHTEISTPVKIIGLAKNSFG